MKKIAIWLLGLAACAQAGAKMSAELLISDKEWYFNFTYPHALPAVVTYAEVLDTDGIFYQFKTLDGTYPSSLSIGRWYDNNNFGIPAFNKAKNLPQFIHFCWDSIIDKKVYETHITLSGTVWEMMLTPLPYPPAQQVLNERYLRPMVIGLAPEGKVRLWLENDNPRKIMLTNPKVIRIDTVSGDQLKMCKGVTVFSRGYEYTDSTIEFIKGKTYPYGEW